MPNIPLELALVIRLRAKKSGHRPTSRKSLFPVWKLFKFQRQVLFIDLMIDLMLKQLSKQYFHRKSTKASSAADRDSLGRYWGSQAGDDVGAE